MLPSLPTKWAIRRAPQSHYPSPAALFVKALARDGLPQAHQLRSLIGAKLLDYLGGGLLDLLCHLGGDLLDLLGHLSRDLGVDALSYLSHTLTYSFPAFFSKADRYLHLKPGTHRLRTHDPYALFIRYSLIRFVLSISGLAREASSRRLTLPSKSLSLEPFPHSASCFLVHVILRDAST